jgi:hypothetical protein
MEEARALATIVGEVRRDVDDGAVARRLYENPARTLVEGELRLLVKSIRRTASGDLAEGSGRPPSGRPRSAVASAPEREMRWADIGGGGADDPARVVDPPSDPPLRDALGPAMDARTEKLLVATAKERAMLEYVVGGADASAIRAGTPRTPPSRPASRGERARAASGASRPGSAGSVVSTRSGMSDGSACSSVVSDPAAAVARVGARRVTIFDVDAVAAPLRELLLEERDALLDDADHLRRCAEEEAEIGRRVRLPPPDVTALRTYGEKLRGVLRDERERAAHVAKVEKMLAAAPNPSDGAKQTLGRVGKLRSLARTLGGGGGGGGGGGDATSARMMRDDVSLVSSAPPERRAALVPAPPRAPPPIGARRPGGRRVAGP